MRNLPIIGFEIIAQHSIEFFLFIICHCNDEKAAYEIINTFYNTIIVAMIFTNRGFVHTPDQGHWMVCQILLDQSFSTDCDLFSLLIT